MTDLLCDTFALYHLKKYFEIFCIQTSSQLDLLVLLTMSRIACVAEQRTIKALYFVLHIFTETLEHGNNRAVCRSVRAYIKHSAGVCRKGFR